MAYCLINNGFEKKHKPGEKEVAICLRPAGGQTGHGEKMKKITIKNESKALGSWPYKIRVSISKNGLTIENMQMVSGSLTGEKRFWSWETLEKDIEGLTEITIDSLEKIHPQMSYFTWLWSWTSCDRMLKKGHIVF